MILDVLVAGIFFSPAAFFAAWSLIYVGQLREYRIPRRDDRLGRWLSFHGRVR